MPRIPIHDQKLRNLTKRMWGITDEDEPLHLGDRQITVEFLLILLIDRVQDLIDATNAP